MFDALNLVPRDGRAHCRDGLRCHSHGMHRHPWSDRGYPALRMIMEVKGVDLAASQDLHVSVGAVDLDALTISDESRRALHADHRR